MKAGTPANTKGSTMKKLLIALLIGAFSIVPLILIGCGDEGEETEADATTEEVTTEEEAPVVEEEVVEEAPVTEETVEGETGTVAEPTAETAEEPVTE